MKHIRNEMAYFTTMVNNLDKNEYRANDNFYNHISSVGDAQDVQKTKLAEVRSRPERNSVELQLTEDCLENWLLHLDNKLLHAAVSALTQDEQRLLYLIYAHGLTQRECGLVMGLPQRTVSYRHEKIKKILKKSLKSC